MAASSTVSSALLVSGLSSSSSSSPNISLKAKSALGSRYFFMRCTSCFDEFTCKLTTFSSQNQRIRGNLPGVIESHTASNALTEAIFFAGQSTHNVSLRRGNRRREGRSQQERVHRSSTTCSPQTTIYQQLTQQEKMTHHWNITGGASPDGPLRSDNDLAARSHDQSAGMLGRHLLAVWRP